MSEALDRLLEAASVINADQSGIDVHPWSEELAREQLAMAARDYVAEVEASDSKPVGWGCTFAVIAHTYCGTRGCRGL